MTKLNKALSALTAVPRVALPTTGMLLAAALLAPREAAAFKPCDTDPVPYYYKDQFYQDETTISFKNNTSQRLLVKVQGDLSFTPVEPGAATPTTWTGKNSSLRYQYWIYAVDSRGQPLQDGRGNPLAPWNATYTAVPGPVYTINGPGSVSHPPEPGSDQYRNLSSDLSYRYLFEYTGPLSCEQWIASGAAGTPAPTTPTTTAAVDLTGTWQDGPSRFTLDRQGSGWVMTATGWTPVNGTSSGRQVSFAFTSSCCTGTLPSGDDNTINWSNGSVWKRQAAASSSEYYYLTVRHSGKCLQQAGPTTNNGGPITQWDCVNVPNMKVKQVALGSDLYNLTFQHTGKCIQQAGPVMDNGGAVTQWDCVDVPNMKLKKVPVDGEYFYLQFQHSGKCLQQAGPTTNNGGPITQWDCVNVPNMHWKFVPAPQ